MSGWGRHLLGTLYGLVVAPVAAAVVAYGAATAGSASAVSAVGRDDLLPIGLITGAVLLLGIAVGSRISPMASLLPGLLFGALGALWVVAPGWFRTEVTWPRGWPGSVLADRAEWGLALMGAHGILVAFGTLLLTASVWPSRWRRRGREEQGFLEEPLLPSEGSPERARSSLPWS